MVDHTPGDVPMSVERGFQPGRPDEVGGEGGRGRGGEAEGDGLKGGTEREAHMTSWAMWLLLGLKLSVPAILRVGWGI